MGGREGRGRLKRRPETRKGNELILRQDVWNPSIVSAHAWSGPRAPEVSDSPCLPSVCSLEFGRLMACCPVRLQTICVLGGVPPLYNMKRGEESHKAVARPLLLHTLLGSVIAAPRWAGINLIMLPLGTLRELDLMVTDQWESSSLDKAGVRRSAEASPQIRSPLGSNPADSKTTTSVSFHWDVIIFAHRSRPPM